MCVGQSAFWVWFRGVLWPVGRCKAEPLSQNLRTGPALDALDLDAVGFREFAQVFLKIFYFVRHRASLKICERLDWVFSNFFSNKSNQIFAHQNLSVQFLFMDNPPDFGHDNHP